MLHLQDGDHVCLIYERTPAEQFPALIPFIRQGLQTEQQVVYVADDQSLEELSRHLTDAGIDVPFYSRCGTLRFLTRADWREPGPLDPQRKTAQVRGFIESARKSGFRGIRFAIEMTWILGPEISPRDLEQWEATLNTLLLTPDFPVRMICQYNRSRLNPESVLAGLRTHPIAVLGEKVGENHFHEAPLILNQSAHAKSPLSAASGKVDWIMAQLKRAWSAEHDRAARIRTRTALSEAEKGRARVEAILNSMADGFCAVDEGWRLTFVNAAAQRIFRRDAEELLGEPLWRLFPRKHEQQCRRAIAQSTSTEFEYTTEAGRCYQVKASPALPSGTSIYFQDITEKKRSEEALREVRQKLEVQVQDLRQLHEMTLRLSAPLDLNSTLHEVLQAALSVHDSNMGLLSLCDPRRNGVQAAASSGFSRPFLKEVEFVPSGSGACGLCHQRRQRVVIEDVETDPSFAPYRAAARRADFRAVHSTPLITCNDRMIGVLSVYFHKRRLPSEREIRLMDLFARQAADMIEGTRLREQAEREAAERLKVEQALRLSEERFRLAAHTEALTLYEQDASLRYVWLYPSHPEHAGAIGKTDLDLLPAAEGRFLSDLKRDVLRTGVTRRNELQTTLPSGVRYYDVFISPRRSSNGEITGVSGVALDITASKRAALQQQALYELVAAVNRAGALEEIYEAALDAICRCHDAERASILVCDEQNVMRFKAWRGLSDAYRRAVEGHSPWRPTDSGPQVIWIDNIADSNVDKHLKAVIQTEGIRALAFIPITYEKQLLGKFMIYYNSTHFFTPEEVRPAQTIASQIAFAMQRQKTGKALEQLVDERTASLREAIAQMEEFSYSVSHDLRAPARAMQGYARAVLEDCAGQLDPQGRDHLERIVRSGVRMDRLIQDILTYSRLNRREVQLQTVSLEKLVREIIAQYPEMQSPRAEIELVQPLHDMVAHEPSLSQAVSNLLSNAVKFVNPGQVPKVRLVTERRGSWTRFWVEDDGIGIKPEHQQRLFGLFERIHPEQRYEGTGIGLAIVRKAVERMGGKVGVVSDGKTGSRFWIELSGEPIKPAP